MKIILTLFSCAFAAQGLKAATPNVTVEGKFSTPYVLSTASRTVDRQTLYAPVVLNQDGRVVWKPQAAEAWAAAPPTAQPLGNGEFIEFYGAKSAWQFDHLLRLDGHGKVLQTVDFAAKGIPPATHGFRYLPDTNEILYNSLTCRKLPWYREFTPLFSGLRGLLNLWRLPRRGYWGGRVVRLNLDTLRFREIWNDYTVFSPDKNPSLFSESANRADFFMDAQNPEEYLALLRQEAYTAPDGMHCHVDWTHENSVDYRAGSGYLISLRNLNKIILVGENGELEWTIGEGPENTFSFPYDGSGFSMQHSASFLDDEHFLLFDNNAAYRGNVGARGVSRLMTIRLPIAPGKIWPEWTFSLDRRAVIKGSVQVLRNGNFFAYVAGDKRQEFFEIDPVKNKQVGRMTVVTGENSSFQSWPVEKLSGVNPVIKAARPLKIKPENWQKIIDRTY